MFRRRRAADLVVFTVDAAGEPTAPSLGPDAEPPPVAGDEPAAPPRARAQAVRQLVAAGSVLVVGLAAWGVTTAVHEHRRVERLLAAPGGLRSLDLPPAERWSAGTESSDATMFLPGVVAVRRGTELVGLDAATGDERWRAEVGGDPTCGTTVWSRVYAPTVDDELVCWSGPNGERSTVTVVTADGRATSRDLPDDVDTVAPAADGGLATARRVGPPVPPPTATVTENAGGWDFEGTIDEGRDAAVRVEDAATGALWWERTVAFQPVADLWSCLDWSATDDGQSLPTIDPSTLAVLSDTSMVTLTGCGVFALFTAGGEATGDADQPLWAGNEPYLDGGVLARGADGTATLHGPHGEAVGTYPVPLLIPWATDGTDTDVRLGAGTAGPVDRYDDAGERLWRSDVEATDVLVRAAGVAVVARSGGALAGLDLRTGATLWSGTVDLTATGDGGFGWPGAIGIVRGAFTDGTTGMVAYAYPDDPTTTLVAFDLATGAERWRQERAASVLVAAEGRLVEVVADDPTVTLVTEEDGAVVRHADGTVRLLG